jgi:tetratricopeptide (TPR) repeat protein
MHYNRGRILLAQGDVARALTAFQQAREAMVKLASETSNPARQFDLATASHGLGLALRASGAPDQARPMFEEFLPFLRTHHAGHDTDAGWLLSANVEQLGEMRLHAGETEAALKLFQEQETRARELRAAAPRESRTALALAIACEKIGGALQQLGRAGEALPKFEEEIQVLHALAGESLDDLMLRRSYIVSLEKLGNVLLILKRPEEARKRFEERLRESEVLARVDPRRVEFRRDLAVAHQRLSSALLALGRNVEALEHARTDLDFTTALAGEYPLDLGIRGDLAASRFQVGLVLLKDGAPTPTKLNEAKGNLGQAAKILRSLADDGKIDQRGKTMLAELDKALEDLSKSRSGGTAPR